MINVCFALIQTQTMRKKSINSHITNTICIYVLRFVLYFFFCIFFRFRYLWFDVNHHLLFFYFIFLPDYYKYNIKIICIYVCFAYRWTQKLREQPFFCFSSFFFALLCCSVFSWYGRHFQLLLQKNRQRVEWKKNCINTDKSTWPSTSQTVRCFFLCFVFENHVNKRAQCFPYWNWWLFRLV